MDDLQALLEVAKATARKAGKKVLELYDTGDYKSYSKEDSSPVTSADYASHEIITESLSQATPDIPIMSEEQANASLEERKDWKRYWLIDPIDGTQEFVAQSGDFGVNIALIEDNQPVIGVICWPVAETLYYASKNKGSFKESPKEDKQIFVRQFEDPLKDEILLAISRRQPLERVMSKMDSSRRYKTLPLGSCSLKSCLIAEGKADLFLRIGVTGEWDTGAPQCIIAEAGGSILSVDFQPLTYNLRTSLINPDFIVLGDQRVDWQNIIRY